MSLMLTPDMKRIIEEQRLGFVATASLDGMPNVSPKGTFAVLDDRTIAFGEIRSPGTIRNLKANPRIEVNFVDAFVRKGYRFTGMATVVERGEPAFDTLLPNLRSALAHRIRAIVTIAVTKALPLTSPAYDVAGGEEPYIMRRRIVGIRKGPVWGPSDCGVQNDWSSTLRASSSVRGPQVLLRADLVLVSEVVEEFEYREGLLWRPVARDIEVDSERQAGRGLGLFGDHGLAARR
jgi:predicted pyridoxine 5'-phosphate oxidase superfamily flavin-nucleotide-binding protein